MRSRCEIQDIKIEKNISPSIKKHFRILESTVKQFFVFYPKQRQTHPRILTSNISILMSNPYENQKRNC